MHSSITILLLSAYFAATVRLVLPCARFLPRNKCVCVLELYHHPHHIIIQHQHTHTHSSSDTLFRAVPEVSRALRVEFARGDGRIKRKEDERRKTIAPRDTLFVVNFQEDTTRREDLEMLFRPYGDLVRIEMKKNYAFVQFKTIEQATKAKDATNGGKLDQSVITVEYVAREPRFGEPARRRPRYHDRYDRRRESPPRSYYRRDSPPRYYRGRSRSRSPGRYRSRSPPRRRGSPYSRHSPGRRSPEYYRGDRGYRGDR